MKVFKCIQEPQKQLIALALAGLVWIGGNTMAMNVDVDSATKDMPGKVESTVLSVPVKTPMINQISDVVYEQVPMRGYPNVAMKNGHPAAEIGHETTCHRLRHGRRLHQCQ